MVQRDEVERAEPSAAPAAARLLLGDRPVPEGREEITHTIIPRLIRWRSRREPLVCHIAESVASDIVFGDLEPGQPLNSVDIARRFEVSRTPVREALALLEQEGLIEIQARRQARVAAPSIAEIREIYELRAQLLALMVRQLVERATPQQIAALSTGVERLRALAEQHNFYGYFAGHVELQDLMTDFAGNATLKRMIDSLALRVLVLRRVSGRAPGRIDAGVAEQTQIVEAICHRDADLAAAAIAHATRQAYLAVEQELRPLAAGTGPSDECSA